MISDAQQREAFARLETVVGPTNARNLRNLRPFFLLRAKPGRLMKMGRGTAPDASLKEVFADFGRNAITDFDGVYGELTYREFILYNPARVAIVGVVWCLGQDETQ